MNILVAKNGSQLGPFSETDTRAKLASGEFSPTDFAWHEGMTAWSPLSQVLGEAAASSAPPAPSPSMSIEPSYAAPSPQPQPYAMPPGSGAYAPQPTNSPYPQPYQPGVTPWGAQGAANYGGFLIRLAAYIIDAIILYIPSAIVTRVLLASNMDIRTVGTLTNIFNIAIAWIYFAMMESSKSQGTLGKMALGLRVTDEAGNRIGFATATGRFFAKILSALILCIGFIMIGFTQRKQGLHDMLAHTLVFGSNRRARLAQWAALVAVSHPFRRERLEPFFHGKARYGSPEHLP